MGQEDKYKKPYVKACFYSVIFSGGAKAMVDSILKSISNDLGLTEKNFNRLSITKKKRARQMK